MARTDHKTQRKAAARAEGRTSAWIAFGLGIGVSVAANVAHTWYPTPTGPTREQIVQWIALSPSHTAENWQPGYGAQAAAAFWPLAVLLAIEMVTRIDWPEGWRWTFARYGGLGVVAAVAAIISYQHMSGLLSAYGETGITTVVGPLAVDGLMIVASVALLATGRVRTGPARAPRDPKPSDPVKPRTLKVDKLAPVRTQTSGEESPDYRAAVDECLDHLRRGVKMPGQKTLGKQHHISHRQGANAQVQAEQEFAVSLNGHGGAQ